MNTVTVSGHKSFHRTLVNTDYTLDMCPCQEAGISTKECVVRMSDTYTVGLVIVCSLDVIMSPGK